MGQYKILQRYKLDIKRKRQLPKSKKVTLTSDQIKKIISDLDEKYFYHWYDEPLNVRLEIKSEVLKKLLDNLVKKYKAKSYRDLLQRTFNIPRGKANTILDWLKKPYPQPQVKSLLYLCKKLKINPKQLEGKNLFTRKFPINLNLKALIKLKTHILNEGTIIKEKGKPHYIARYINQDPALHKYVIKLLKELGAKVAEEPYFDHSRNSYVTTIDATTTRILHKAGLPYGKKTITNPTLDPQIFTNPELRKYHFQATLTEDGSSSIYLTKDKRLRMTISWSRSIDITDKLTPQQIQKIKQLTTEKERKISKKLLKKRLNDKQLISAIYDNIPQLLLEEVAVLKASHREFSDLFPKLYLDRVHVSKSGRITVSWVFRTQNPKLIDLLCNEYGMLDGTWKAHLLKVNYTIYKMFRNKKINAKEKSQIEKIASELLNSYRNSK